MAIHYNDQTFTPTLNLVLNFPTPHMTQISSETWFRPKKSNLLLESFMTQFFSIDLPIKGSGYYNRY